MLARRLAAVSWCAAALVAPHAPAHALVPQQVVTIASAYAPSEVTILAGDTLTLTNLDPQLEHDLVSEDTVAGVRVFRTNGAIPFGGQAAVAGVEKLPPSVYPFFCSLHEYMRGNLTVQAV